MCKNEKRRNLFRRFFAVYDLSISNVATISLGKEDVSQVLFPDNEKRTP